MIRLNHLSTPNNTKHKSNNINISHFKCVRLVKKILTVHPVCIQTITSYKINNIN